MTLPFFIAATLMMAPGAIGRTFDDGPTTPDLRAAYCISVLNYETNELARIAQSNRSSGFAQGQQLADDVAGLRARLLRYFAPHMSSIQQDILALTMSRGYTDARLANVEALGIVKSCEQRSAASAVRQCETSHAKSPTFLRTQTCRDLSWLNP
jgi:hypothetical protein